MPLRKNRKHAIDYVNGKELPNMHNIHKYSLCAICYYYDIEFLSFKNCNPIILTVR